MISINSHFAFKMRTVSVDLQMDMVVLKANSSNLHSVCTAVVDLSQTQITKVDSHFILKTWVLGSGWFCFVLQTRMAVDSHFVSRTRIAGVDSQSVSRTRIAVVDWHFVLKARIVSDGSCFVLWMRMVVAYLHLVFQMRISISKFAFCALKCKWSLLIHISTPRDIFSFFV